MEQNATDFKTSIELRIDWSDIDLLGHVNNISYFRYIQSARVNYLELTGFMELYNAGKTGPLLASSSCQFLKPLFYPGQIRVLTQVESIKNTSFCLKHMILNEKEEIVATATDIIVLFDFNGNHKITIPQSIRETIQNRECRIFK